MNRQRGQSAVEFALMAPIVFMMIFGMIWGGIMFMEYLHYSNAVRTAARVIAVTDADKRESAITTQANFLREAYEKEISVRLYKPYVNITLDPEGDNPVDAVVNVTFVMEDATYNSLPNILKSPSDVSYGLGFPPKSIKAIQYRMRLEKLANEQTNDDQSDG